MCGAFSISSAPGQQGPPGTPPGRGIPPLGCPGPAGVRGTRGAGPTVRNSRAGPLQGVEFAVAGAGLHGREPYNYPLSNCTTGSGQPDVASWLANRLYATTGCPNCVCQPVIRHNRLSKLCLPFGCPDANRCAMHLVRSMKNMAAYQLNPRHQHGPLACLLRILRFSLDQMKGVPYGLTPKRGRLTTGCLATGCGQLAWQPVARHNRLPTSGLATGCPPQPVVQIPFDTIWAPPVAELIAWFSTGGVFRLLKRYIYKLIPPFRFAK